MNRQRINYSVVRQLVLKDWYLNRAVKIQADFEQTHFDGGATTGDRKTANEILTRFQVGF